MNDLEVKEPAEISAQISDLSVRALSIKVTDDASLIMADDLLSAHKKMEKGIKGFFEKMKKKAHEAHKQVCDDENTELQKLLPAEQYLKQQISDYKMTQQRIREAEETRLRAEAAKREEEERIERAAEIEAEAASLKAAGQTEEAEATYQEAERTLNTPAWVPTPRVVPLPKTKSTLKMVVDREKLQTICDIANKGNHGLMVPIPGIRLYQVWQYEIINESMVPESWKRPSVGGRT